MLLGIPFTPASATDAGDELAAEIVTSADASPLLQVQAPLVGL